MPRSNVVPIIDELCQGISRVDAHDLTQAVIRIGGDVSAMKKGLEDLERDRVEVIELRTRVDNLSQMYIELKKDTQFYRVIFGVIAFVITLVNGFEIKLLYEILAMHLKQ